MGTEMKTQSYIKDEAVKMLKTGRKAKDVERELFNSYGQNMTYREFDSKYGRFIRHKARKVAAGEDISGGSERYFSGKPTVKNSLTYNASGDIDIEASIPGDQPLTAEAILRQNNLNPNEFEVVAAKFSSWDAQTADGVQQMQAAKLSVKPLINTLTDEDIIGMVQRRLDRMNKQVVANPKPAYKVNQNDRIAVWHMGDFHYGRECLKEEVGIEWNTKLAAEDLHFMKEQLIQDLQIQPVSKLLLAISGDSLNADTMDGSTAHGTPQDMAMRWNKLFEEYFNLITGVIDEISASLQIPIEYVHVIGNHDQKTMWDMLIALSAYYRHDDNVSIKLELNRRKYRKYGNTLMMFTHGDTEKNRILDAPVQEAQSAYGSTKYCYVFTEHLHNLKTTTKGAIVAYQTCSPAPADRWTKNSAYLGSRRGSELFIIDKYRGMISQNFLFVKNEEVDEFVVDVEDIA